MKTPIVEIMSSIQGEGIVVGYRQVFVRFSGCNIKCRYCDTQHLLQSNQPCMVEQTPGSGDYLQLPNPLSPAEIQEILLRFPLQRHHSISLTGGEPLLHLKFLQELIPMISGQGPQIYLETNGTLPKALEQVIELVDIVSMDIKLPSVTGCQDLWAKHAEFLKVARQKQVYVKAVVGQETPPSEIVQICQLIAEIDQNIPLIFQPVTPTNGVKAPEPARLMELLDQALTVLKDVRVIPQTHRMLGVL